MSFIEQEMVDNSRLQQQITNVESDVNSRGINIMFPPAPLVGAKGDYNPSTGQGTDDTAAIQAIIDYANSKGIRKVFAPGAKYLISGSIIQNGCTIVGNTVSIYNANKVGTAFYAKTNDFTAIKQGSVNANDIEYGISDVFVINAKVAFEINYAINSIFERLFVQNSDIGFKLGDITSVGSMFCEFNNLYTLNTRIGVIIQSKDYFNNNRFNNGFIYGSEKSFHLEVVGGYGAVNNVFNSVEFRSPNGRGIILINTINTAFNHVYFECGGNAIRSIGYSSIIINDCIFGLFKANNANHDTSFVFAEGGLRLKLNGGTIFLTSENDNTTFYDCVNPDTYLNIYVTNNIATLGRAENFKRFKSQTNEIAYKTEKQAITTPTLSLSPNTSGVLNFTFPTPFSKAPDFYSVVMRGSEGMESNIQWVLVTITATGGQISVRNNSSGARYINFRVCAEVT